MERPEKIPKTLEHHMRRRAMRQLHSSDDPLSASQLAALEEEPLGSAGYHLRVLEGAPLVKSVSEKQVRGVAERFFASLVEGNEAVLAFLEETREADEELKRRRREGRAGD